MKPVVASRVLGIDPGSRITGYGIVEQSSDKRLVCIAQGQLRLPNESLERRLCCIHEGISELVAIHKPQLVAAEQVFVHQNVDTALKLGQARGAAIVAATLSGLGLFEYAPRAIKQTVVGSGAASKEQVQFMIKTLLALEETPATDAADALAVAVCHLQHAGLNSAIAATGGNNLPSRKRGRGRGLRWS